MLALKTTKQTVTQFAFSADGRYLTAGGTGRKVHLWDLTAKKLRPKVLPTFEYATEWVGFLPDGRMLALSKMGQYAIHDPIADTTTEASTGYGWPGYIVAAPDASAFYGTGWKVRKWTFDGRLHEAWWHDVSEKTLHGSGGSVLTPEGTLVSAVSEGGNKTWFQTRDTETGQLQSEQHVAESLVRTPALLPDGRTFAFIRERHWQGKVANAVMIGTLDGGFEPLLIAKGKNEKPFTSCALHPSGKWLAVGHADGTVRVFDTTIWCEAVAYQWHVKPVEGLVFSPDGLKAAAGGAKGQVVVWDVDL